MFVGSISIRCYSTIIPQTSDSVCHPAKISGGGHTRQWPITGATSRYTRSTLRQRVYPSTISGLMPSCLNPTFVAVTTWSLVLLSLLLLRWRDHHARISCHKYMSKCSPLIRTTFYSRSAYLRGYVKYDTIRNRFFIWSGTLEHYLIHNRAPKSLLHPNCWSNAKFAPKPLNASGRDRFRNQKGNTASTRCHPSLASPSSSTSLLREWHYNICRTKRAKYNHNWNIISWVSPAAEMTGWQASTWLPTNTFR